MQDLAAIILAAGGARRMGQPKQLLTLGGRTLLSRAIATADAAGCRPIVVVIGAHAAEVRQELEGRDVWIAENPDWEKGIGTSIRSGVGALIAMQSGANRLVLLLCDQPGVTDATIRRLDDTRQAMRRPVCVSTYGGTIGAPVLVSGAFVKQLMALADDSGAKSIWVHHSDAVCEVPCPEAAADIDTPDDYAAQLARFE